MAVATNVRQTGRARASYQRDKAIIRYATIYVLFSPFPYICMVIAYNAKSGSTGSGCHLCSGSAEREV